MFSGLERYVSPSETEVLWYCKNYLPNIAPPYAIGRYSNQSDWLSTYPNQKVMRPVAGLSVYEAGSLI